MKTDFSGLVESHAGGVFRCHTPLPPAALAAAASKNMLVVPVRLTAARDKNAFLNAVAKALQFPTYFGHNWDAFYDCLLDLKHGDVAGTLLILQRRVGFCQGRTRGIRRRDGHAGRCSGLLEGRTQGAARRRRTGDSGARAGAC